MSHRTNAWRLTATAALVGIVAVTGSAAATADPAGTGNRSDINTLAASLSKGYGLNNCTAENITGGELAALTCDKGPTPAGPCRRSTSCSATATKWPGRSRPVSARTF